jgi:hypothetical protein
VPFGLRSVNGVHAIVEWISRARRSMWTVSMGISGLIGVIGTSPIRQAACRSSSGPKNSKRIRFAATPSASPLR